MREVVHMVEIEGEAKNTVFVNDVRTRCGRLVAKPIVDGTPTRYEMISENGNIFHCTSRTKFVTCIKCNAAIEGTLSGRRED